MNVRTICLSAAAVAALCMPLIAAGQAEQATWPARVLITNDNGIEDVKIWALAKAFSRVAETWIVAPAADRSGTGSFLSLGSRDRAITVERDYESDSLKAYAVQGYPADCVIVGVGGLMADRPPDLVVSGINGGANLSDDWFGSGTVGAARTAAFVGLPAIAVSGLDDDDDEAVAAATEWVVRLAQSDVVRTLKPGRYLTVSMPRKSPGEIKGVTVATRAHGLFTHRMERFSGLTGSEEDSLWVLQYGEMLPPPENSDIAAYIADYIVIVPMKVDEHDYELLEALKAREGELPGWPPR